MAFCRSLVKVGKYSFFLNNQPLRNHASRSLKVKRCFTSQANSVKHNFDNKRKLNEKEDKYSEETRKRYAKSYSLFIGSVVGILGSSYVLYKQSTQVEAKEIDHIEDGIDDVEKLDMEGIEVAKHAECDHSSSIHKSHATFKERKVRINRR